MCVRENERMGERKMRGRGEVVTAIERNLKICRGGKIN